MYRVMVLGAGEKENALEGAMVKSYKVWVVVVYGVYDSLVLVYKDCG